VHALATDIFDHNGRQQEKTHGLFGALPARGAEVGRVAILVVESQATQQVHRTIRVVLSAADELLHAQPHALRPVSDSLLQTRPGAPHPQSGHSQHLTHHPSSHSHQVHVRPLALRLLPLQFRNRRTPNEALLSAGAGAGQHSGADGHARQPALRLPRACSADAGLHSGLPTIQVAVREPALRLELAGSQQSALLPSVRGDAVRLTGPEQDRDECVLHGERVGGAAGDGGDGDCVRGVLLLVLQLQVPGAL
jgi:hypothetical protein